MLSDRYINISNISTLFFRKKYKTSALWAINKFINKKVEKQKNKKNDFFFDFFSKKVTVKIFFILGY